MSSSRKKATSKSKKSKQTFDLFYVGLTMFIVALTLLLLTFFPVIKEEGRYLVLSQEKVKNESVKPVNEDFSIVIPKIAANSAIIGNVDPFDSKAYRRALTRGVAHAAGSAYPGNVGNSFIFAHSSADWFIANRYNSVFYLLHKLEKGDKIEVYYKKKKYAYEVTDKRQVDPSDVSYLGNKGKNDSSYLTLMTCWPPGTTFKRLIIQAKISR